MQIVREAIPEVYFNLDPPVPAADISVHILNHLYKKLNAVCLVEGGQVVRLSWLRATCTQIYSFVSVHEM